MFFHTFSEIPVIIVNMENSANVNKLQNEEIPKISTVNAGEASKSLPHSGEAWILLKFDLYVFNSGEMQSKTWVRYHVTLALMVIMKMSTNKCCRGFSEKGTFKHQWWECKLVWPLWMTVQSFLIKLKTELPNDPAVRYLEKIIIQKYTCSPKFTAVLFTIPIWQQAKCPLRDEWIKMCYLYWFNITEA